MKRIFLFFPIFVLFLVIFISPVLAVTVFQETADISSCSGFPTCANIDDDDWATASGNCAGTCDYKSNFTGIYTNIQQINWKYNNDGTNNTIHISERCYRLAGNIAKIHIRLSCDEGCAGQYDEVCGDYLVTFNQIFSAGSINFYEDGLEWIYDSGWVNNSYYQEIGNEYYYSDSNPQRRRNNNDGNYSTFSEPCPNVNGCDYQVNYTVPTTNTTPLLWNETQWRVKTDQNFSNFTIPDNCIDTKLRFRVNTHTNVADNYTIDCYNYSSSNWFSLESSVSTDLDFYEESMLWVQETPLETPPNPNQELIDSTTSTAKNLILLVIFGFVIIFVNKELMQGGEITIKKVLTSVLLIITAMYLIIVLIGI